MSRSESRLASADSRYSKLDSDYRIKLRSRTGIASNCRLRRFALSARRGRFADALHIQHLPSRKRTKFLSWNPVPQLSLRNSIHLQLLMQSRSASEVPQLILGSMRMPERVDDSSCPPTGKFVLGRAEPALQWLISLDDPEASVTGGENQCTRLAVRQSKRKNQKIPRSPLLLLRFLRSLRPAPTRSMRHRRIARPFWRSLLTRLAAIIFVRLPMHDIQMSWITFT